MILPDGRVSNVLNTTHSNVLQAKSFWQRWRQTFVRSKQKNHRQEARSRRFWVQSLLVGSTVAVSAIGLGSYQIVRTIILDNSKKQALLEAHEGCSNIDQWLASRKAEVVVLANSPITRTMNWSVIEPYFKAEVKRQQDFDQLTLAQPDGSYANTNSVKATGTIRDRVWFRKSMVGEINVSDPLMSRTAHVVKVFVGAPITSPSNPKPVGVIGEAIQVNRVTQVVNQMQQDSGSYAFALNSQGFLIAHPNPAMITTPEKPGPNLLRSENSAFAAIAQEMVDRREGIQLIQLDGAPRYIAYVPLSEANWSVALVIPRQTIESALGALNVLAGVLALVLLIAIAGAWRYVQDYEQTRLRAAQEALLNRLTTRIRESLDLPTIVQTTVTELSTLLDLQRVFLGTYNPAAQTLSLVGDSYMTGKNEQPLEFQTTTPGDLADSLKGGKTLRLDPVTTSDHASLELTAGAYLAVANPTQNGQIGFLIGLHTSALNPEDKDLLRAVSDQLAIAVTQAQLYSQTQEQVDLLNQTLTKLNQTQLQLVQSEKMSSLGQLVAGIAHEINNPVNFIHGNIIHANQYAQELLALLQLYQVHMPCPPAPIQAFMESIDVAFVSEDFPKLLESMQVGTERIREIVRSLRVFSRLDEAEVKGVDIHEGIDCTLMILQSRLQAKALQCEIQVVKEYGQLPTVECYAGQLNQVFMNILSNAIEALEERAQHSALRTELAEETAQNIPTIRIRTEVTDNHHIKICVTDTGSGIPDAVQARIFDPFFTTKAVGKGTGMGLAISYQIVTERHKGRLYCTSTPDQGTEFVIEIPMQQSEHPLSPHHAVSH